MANQLTSAKPGKAGLKVGFRTQDQNSEAGRIGGQTTKLLRVGIHALTVKEKADAGRKGGLLGGAVAKERKLGVHALTRQQLSAAGMKAASLLGAKLWKREEDIAIVALRQDSAYQHGLSASHPGKPNWGLIAMELNIRFHNCDEARSAHATEVRYSQIVKILLNGGYPDQQRRETA